MKFFIPYADSEQQAANVFNSTKEFAEQQTGFCVSDRKIFSISYRHDGKDYHAEVGQIHGRINEEIIVNLESRTGMQTVVYLVCSPNRCVLRGSPMLVGENEVKEVIYFEN
jgi:hypothetical protein